MPPTAAEQNHRRCRITRRPTGGTSFIEPSITVDVRFTGPAAAFDDHDQVFMPGYDGEPRRPHPVTCEQLHWHPEGLDCAGQREMLLDDSFPAQTVLVTRSADRSDIFAHVYSG